VSDLGPNTPQKSHHVPPLSSGTSEPSVPGKSDGTAATRLLGNKRGALLIAAAALLFAVGGLVAGFATSGSATPVKPPVASSPAAVSNAGGQKSNARSAPSMGGASGTVGTVSASSFTLTTSTGQKVTVNEASSTTYENGSTSTSTDAITRGETVLALGITDGASSGTTIAATQVIVEPAGYDSSSTSSAAVTPFQIGVPTTTKTVGQIPANWSQGQGTIISGAAANKATEAALAAYPGAIVDRVVLLSNGEYNVHYIGVNWPHHVFVTSDFKVVGAE
jgi:hypothetical protein